MIEAYFDGACEPVNPGGHAAYGIVIFAGSIKIAEESEYFPPGNTSNNLAEYLGFEKLLNILLDQGLCSDEIIIRGDSQLVIGQMFGFDGKLWRINQGIYIPAALRCQEIVPKFSNIWGQWVRRENNLAEDASKRELRSRGVEFRIQPE